MLLHTVIGTSKVSTGVFPSHADPTKEGCIFTGWTPALSGVTADVTYTAKFYELPPENPDKVALSFNTVYGSYVDTQLLNKGGKPKLPASVPDKKGYTFEGWYTDASGSKAFDFNAPITDNTVAVAKWRGSPVPAGLKLYGIQITTPPDKTTYTAGENFDQSGMVVTALYTRVVDDYGLSPLDNLKTSDTAVTVSYTENTDTKTAQQPITVNPAEPIKYRIIIGANQVIFTSDTSALFASDADFSKFDHVEVDGMKVAKMYYTAESGSTMITFNQDYIKTLRLGEHKLTIASTDGSASTSFTVSGPLPPTGDSTHPAMLMMLLLASVGTILLISASARRKKYR